MTGKFKNHEGTSVCKGSKYVVERYRGSAVSCHRTLKAATKALLRFERASGKVLAVSKVNPKTGKATRHVKTRHAF